MTILAGTVWIRNLENRLKMALGHCRQAQGDLDRERAKAGLEPAKRTFYTAIEYDAAIASAKSGERPSAPQPAKENTMVDFTTYFKLRPQPQVPATPPAPVSSSGLIDRKMEAGLIIRAGRKRRGELVEDDSMDPEVKAIIDAGRRRRGEIE